MAPTIHLAGGVAYGTAQPRWHHLRRAGSTPRIRMPEPELGDVVIREAMRRAEKAVCPPADQRCYGYAQTALASRTPEGWCLIGWAAAESCRKTWDAWYNVLTGEGRLKRHHDG